VFGSRGVKLWYFLNFGLMSSVSKYSLFAVVITISWAWVSCTNRPFRSGSSSSFVTWTFWSVSGGAMRSQTERGNWFWSLLVWSRTKLNTFFNSLAVVTSTVGDGPLSFSLAASRISRLSFTFCIKSVSTRLLDNFSLKSIFSLFCVFVSNNGLIRSVEFSWNQFFFLTATSG